MSLFGEPGARECSRSGCREAAVWRIDWRNPQIHTGDRGKTWLACDEHREFLNGFLSSRGFPVSVSPLSQEPEAPAHSAG
ncbi:hypothetical protein D7I44_15860 [Gryllotalpicola protaetiae]|uniref:Acetone carboxylase n=1 Tax=Gryllotalpicola protaetiae TaxID=2419771 RepID=A0A387BUU7_9MICO|nr:hypothetical protein [Gryllotalpicola protaetiae]AYG04856.1 hypothetical protein D7I44_15860 [Gryllotalpicola protaetiae]